MTSYRHSRVVLGLPVADIEIAANAVRRVLAVALRPRESSHYGGEYYLGETTLPEDLRLFRNIDAVDGTSHHGDATRSPLVLRLMGTDRDPAEVAEQLGAALGAQVVVLEVT